MIQPATASASSAFVSFLCIGLFIWGRHKSGPTVDPVHAPHNSMAFRRVGTDMGAPCSWWAPNQLGISALKIRFHQKETGTVVSRRAIDECLVAPLAFPNVIRTTPGQPSFLVDHTSARGGIFKNHACPGYADYIATFDGSLAAWVGCTHERYPAWTGYVCVHPPSNTVALKCFEFHELPACHLGEHMPCTPYKEDMGCKAGLMSGEYCIHTCTHGHRSRASSSIQTTCPLESPECEPMCPLGKLPTSPEWVPFLIIWDDNLQEAKVESINPKKICTPDTLKCSGSFLDIQCRPIHCDALPWAGIHAPKVTGTVVYPECTEGYASGAPVITCRLDGTWSHQTDSCVRKRSSHIITSSSECIYNQRTITQTVLDPGFPPIATQSRQSWTEPCKSPPPSCCKNQGLASSFGYYDNHNNPGCQCKYAHLGLGNPSPCCSFSAPIPLPPLVFFQTYKGQFNLIPCDNNECNSGACYNHPMGCLAFNQTHMARYAPESNTLKGAFSWEL